jgi:hypothetical protein
VITNPGALTPVFSGVAKMNTTNLENLGASADQAHAMTEQFFEQIEPKIRKGRAWTFHRMSAAYAAVYNRDSFFWRTDQ